MNVLFGASDHFLKHAPVDLLNKELIVYVGLIILMF